MICLKAFCRIAHDTRFAPLGDAARECLERALLSLDVSAPFPSAWRDCYDQILFPIVSGKLKAAAAAGNAADMDPNAWRDCYDQILFPIVSGKLKAAAVAENAADEEVCIRSVLLLCRSFRQNLHVIILLPEMHMLWLRLLGLIEAFKHRIRAVQRDAVTNDVVLTLKDMLQAMHSDPSFQKVQHASGQDMWVLTSTVLETFCPDLKSELMPTGSTPNKPHRDSAAPTQPRWGGATEAPAAPGVATEVAAGVAAGVATPPPSAPSSSAPPVALLDPGGMPREAEVGGGAGAGGGMRGGLYPAMALNDSSVAVGDSVGAQMAPIEGLVPS